MLTSLLILQCQCWLCQLIYFSLWELTDMKSVNARPISHTLLTAKPSRHQQLGHGSNEKLWVYIFIQCMWQERRFTNQGKKALLPWKTRAVISSGSNYTLIFIFWPNHSKTRNLSISLSFMKNKTTKDYCNFDFWITGAIGFLWLHFSLNSACIPEIILFQLDNCQQCSTLYNPVSFLQSSAPVFLASSVFSLLVYCQPAVLFPDCKSMAL